MTEMKPIPPTAGLVGGQAMPAKVSKSMTASRILAYGNSRIIPLTQGGVYV